MNKQFRYVTAMIVLATAALVALLPATFGSAAPAAKPLAAPTATTTVELLASGDARTRSGSSTSNQGSSSLFFLTENSDYNFIQFDLSALPADATIDAADPQTNANGQVIVDIDHDDVAETDVVGVWIGARGEVFDTDTTLSLIWV